MSSYVRVIGKVKDDFDMKESLALDVRPVSSGNKITSHLLEVAYSADKVMEEKMDEELRAVNLDQIICKYQSAIYKKQRAICAIDFDEDDDLNAFDLNTMITGHMEDIASEKL